MFTKQQNRLTKHFSERVPIAFSGTWREEKNNTPHPSYRWIPGWIHLISKAPLDWANRPGPEIKGLILWPCLSLPPWGPPFPSFGNEVELAVLQGSHILLSLQLVAFPLPSILPKGTQTSRSYGVWTPPPPAVGGQGQGGPLWAVGSLWAETQFFTSIPSNRSLTLRAETKSH